MVQYGSLLGDLPLGTVPGTFLSVLSHLPHLVWLNRTRVSFPSWCGSFGQVRNAAIALGCAPKADQTSVPRPPWRGGLGTLSNEPWSGSFVVRTQSDLKQTKLQKGLHFWTKPAALVSCTMHYGLRKCLLTVCSLAWHVADKLGVVRKCGAS